MPTDQQIESEIQAKGLTAPRVTPADIEAEIASEHYFTAMDGLYGELMSDGVPPTNYERAQWPASLGLLTFCVLALKNGFTVTGESACASPENFDAQIGRKIARTNAVNQIWPLLGFRLRDALHEVAQDKARGPRYRDAVTGEYVTAEYARANPATTVKES